MAGFENVSGAVKLVVWEGAGGGEMWTHVDSFCVLPCGLMFCLLQ